MFDKFSLQPGDVSRNLLCPYRNLLVSLSCLQNVLWARSFQPPIFPSKKLLKVYVFLSRHHIFHIIFTARKEVFIFQYSLIRTDLLHLLPCYQTTLKLQSLSKQFLTMTVDYWWKLSTTDLLSDTSIICCSFCHVEVVTPASLGFIIVFFCIGF